MKNMRSAQEFIQVAPKGRYPSIITKAEAKLSNKGDPQLALIVEIAEGEYAGDQAYDYIGTDGNAKGAGIYSKPKLRSLGVDVETDNEIPDAVIAQQLQGIRVMVDYDNQPRMAKSRPDDASCPYDTVVTFPDPRTGAAITVMNLVVKGYSRIGGAPQQLAPQQGQWQGQSGQVAQPQYAPQAQAPVQYAQQPVFAPQVAQPQFAPQQLQPQFAPQAYAQPVQNAPVQQTQATVPWAGAPAGQAPNGQAPAAAAPAGRRRKLQATDVPPETGN